MASGGVAHSLLGTFYGGYFTFSVVTVIRTFYTFVIDDSVVLNTFSTERCSINTFATVFVTCGTHMIGS